MYSTYISVFRPPSASHTEWLVVVVMVWFLSAPTGPGQLHTPPRKKNHPMLQNQQKGKEAKARRGDGGGGV
jgi:hypothetical protein